MFCKLAQKMVHYIAKGGDIMLVKKISFKRRQEEGQMDMAERDPVLAGRRNHQRSVMKTDLKFRE